MHSLSEQTPATSKNAGSGLQLSFGFGGLLDDVFRKHFLIDADSAQLSSKFRAYYRLRPFIPIFARQLLQRGRNGNLSVPEDWFIPTDFLREFKLAIDQEIQQNPNRTVLHPWPDDYQFASVLTHDVETRQGVELVPALAEMEQEYGFRSAWNFIPHKYKIDDGLIQALQDAGHEVGVHGYNHDGNLFASRRTFNRRSVSINQAIQDFGSVGFRAPMVHRNLEWMQDLNVDYDASCFDIDPYQAMPGGCGGLWPFIAGKFVELPYTLPQDHTLLIALGERSIRIWEEKLSLIKRWSGMSLVITHPDYLDTPERLDIYRKFLEHLAEQSQMWAALPSEVAQWWRLRQKSMRDLGSSDHLGSSVSQSGRLVSLDALFGILAT